VIGARALLPWTDDLFLHGHQLTPWITDYVDLEESLAVGSVAQEELAHANALIEQAAGGVEERDWRIFVREAEAWFPSSLVIWGAADWPATVARGFLFAHASLVLMAWIGENGNDRLKATAQVIAAEQQLHARHWTRWVSILADEPATAPLLTRALDELGELASDLYGLEEADGIGDLYPVWTEAVTEALVGLGLSAPRLPERVTPRAPGGGIVGLSEILAGLRQLRTQHPERVYRVYR
jgi:1,2-phenylacetyl-CoA epoxidase catalytic subunit